MVSGLGVWPLLAILAGLAEGPAQDELFAAAGAPYEGLLNSPEVRMALGLWTRSDVPLRPELEKLVPIGVLTDQQALDDWVVEQTGGLLQKMPVILTDEVRLLLASALTVRTTWQRPFEEDSRIVAARRVRWLTRSDSDVDSVRLHETATGPLTVVTVHGAGEIDVRLVIGQAGRGRSEVLAAALELDDSGIGGSELLDRKEAPGLEVIESMSPKPTAILSMPYFEVEAVHNLLHHAEVFGLVTATDNSRGHFPGLSPEPLAVNGANQAVMARFSALGFEAAAVTVIGWIGGSVPQPGAKALLVNLNRPFGFIAVHRPTGIPLVAGWITESAYQPA